MRLGLALLFGLTAAPLAAEERPWHEVEGRADALHALLTLPPQDAALTAPAEAAFAAAGLQACTGTVARIVVLPVRADGTRLAYFLSRARTPAQVVTGGAWRVTLAADGAVGTPEVLAEGCGTFGWDEGDDELGLGVAYIQRPAGAQPTEFDMLLSREAPFPLGMVAEPYVWPLIAGRTEGPVEADPEMFASE